jgi:hypothetical protein
LPNLLGLLADPSAPDFLLVALEEPETPVSELCEAAPDRLPDRVEVEPDELSELVEPDMPEELALTPNCCAVSESTLPVAFRLFDF